MMDDRTEAFILCMEEQAELMQALCKMERYLRVDKTLSKEMTQTRCFDNLVEEIADVEICIEKIKKQYNISDELVRLVKGIKEKRTKERRKNG